MRRTFGLIIIATAVIIAIFIALSHTSSGSGPSAAPSSTLSPSQFVAPAAAASSGPCTTRACIVEDAKETLVGGLAKDNAVMTSLACKKATVKHAAPGVWTTHCTADYSDGMKAAGIASVLLSQNKVSWEPTDILDYGSGG